MPFNESNETQQVDAAPEVAQPTETAANQPSYITTDQLKDLETRLTQKIDQVYRGVQSRTDQFTAKVNQKIAFLENAAKSTGIPLNESQRKLMQDQAILQTLSEEASPPQSQGIPGQVLPQGSGDELAERVNAAAYTMQVAAGVEITENDPENAIMVAAENGTPKQYLDAVRQAIDAKEARLKGSPPAVTPQAGTPKSPGVVKGVPQSNPIENISDPAELWKLTSFAKRG